MLSSAAAGGPADAGTPSIQSMSYGSPGCAWGNSAGMGAYWNTSLLFDASIIAGFCVFISLECVKCRIIFGHQKRVCPEWTVRICS